VTSNRDRDRAAARARLEREMAVRADAAHKRRRTQTIVASAAAAVVVIGAVVWIAVATSGDESDPTVAASASPSGTGSAAPTTCEYKSVSEPPSPGGSAQPLPPGAKEVGKPSPDVPRTGKQTMTLATSQGVIKIEMDLSKVPCTAGSFAYLAGKKFFDNTKCHRLVPDIGALQCGDPVGDGTGGPTYRFGDENLPINRRPAYPEGVVAMANAGPDTNGSQFFFVYKDSPLQGQYTLIGKITEGLDIIKKIGEGGHDGAYDPNPGGGHPKTEVVLRSVTVSAPAA
jgi:peptidyl-prolyl cis-trans isomerase B (cyclophilin B)